MAKANKKSTAPRRRRKRPPPRKGKKRPPQPRQPEGIPISAKFEGSASLTPSKENWQQTVVWESLGPERSITQTTTHLIGAREPLDPKRKSGRRGGRPRSAFDPATIKAAQDDLARALKAHPQWRYKQGHAVRHVVEFLELDQQQAKSKRRSIERSIVWPVCGPPPR
jgi:hypothetical protein